MHLDYYDSSMDFRPTNKTDEVCRGVMMVILKKIQELIFQTKFKLLNKNKTTNCYTNILRPYRTGTPLKGWIFQFAALPVQLNLCHKKNKVLNGGLF